MTRRLTLAITLLLLTLFALAPRAAKTLEIWFIDVEGGQSTLIVTPAGESLLIDAGYSPNNLRGANPPTPGGRDPVRILATLKEAGVTRIDYFLLTHPHPDHAGGVPLLADKIEIDTFIDYGPPQGTPIGPDRLTMVPWRDYEPVRAKAKRIILAHPGDRLPLKGVDALIVSAGGGLITRALPEGGQTNSACVNVEDHPEDGTENFRSVGVVFKFGAFRFYDPGDLSGNTLTRLACPKDMLGPMSAYLISHHGDYDTSIPALYAALKPRVAIMNNGIVRGGHPEALRVVKAEPTIEDLWQLHATRNEGAENAPEPFLANIDDGTLTNYALKLSASDDGSFRIVNPRTGFTRDYPKTRSAGARPRPPATRQP